GQALPEPLRSALAQPDGGVRVVVLVRDGLAFDLVGLRQLRTGEMVAGLDGLEPVQLGRAPAQLRELRLLRDQPRRAGELAALREEPRAAGDDTDDVQDRSEGVRVELLRELDRMALEQGRPVV